MSGNTSPAEGGGIYNAPTWNVIASASTISGNTAGDGAGIYNDVSGDLSAYLSLTSSTVSGNSSSLEGAAGIDNPGDAVLTDSTVSGNESFNENDEAGGIFDPGQLLLTNSTISNNTGGEYGGGLFATGYLTIAGTIIAGNSYPDCGATGTTTDNGYNLIGVLTPGCFATVLTDITNTDPVLGPLAKNGGSTKTMPPLVGSPVINAIPTPTCKSSSFLGTNPLDQRGITRPQGGACEIGSVEVLSPVIDKFSPASGKTGAKVTITGKNLNVVSAVYFDGFSAVFKIVSATKITATVPSRAKTGPIMVTAAGGNYSSTTNFKVT